MESLGHFEKVEDRVIPMKYSDRSKTPIEPFLSDQWFVKMDKLAQDAIDAVEDGRVRFFPQRYAKTYIDWLAEKRDWCISRQLWWGHRIPIWSKKFSSEQTEEARSMAACLGISVDDALRRLQIVVTGPDQSVSGDQLYHPRPDLKDSLAAVVVDGLEPGEKLQLFCVGDGCEELRRNLKRRIHSGPRRPRHMVQFRTLATRHTRLAGSGTQSADAACRWRGISNFKFEISN